MPEISIIVPVYKVELYLRRCIDSILAQTFTDFELILVDDGSPDNCPAICDTYAKKDRRIRVIHNQNGGASAARNSGLDIACGKYVMFCDSDDVVSPKWIEHLLTHANENTLAVCSYCNMQKDLGNEKNLSIQSGEQREVSDYFLFNQLGIAGYLCNALYINETIQTNHLRLRSQKERGDYNEDLLFTLQYINYVKYIIYVGYSDYLYDKHNDSLSNSHPAVYYKKYEEKYILWKEFIEKNKQAKQIKDLSTSMLFHFLTALDYSKFPEFKQIIESEITQQCISLADTSAENPRIIRLIKKRAVIRLWLLYKLHTLKGRVL